MTALKKEPEEDLRKYGFFPLLNDRRKLKVRKIHDSRDSSLAFNLNKQWDLTLYSNRGKLVI